MFSEDIYSIHGQSNRGRRVNSSDMRQAVLVASVCDRDRQIMEGYSEARESDSDAEARREFRAMRSMMQGNRGVL